MVEDISIAVTIENNSIPEMISLKELKSLIATAASPKVSPDKRSRSFEEFYIALSPEESTIPVWEIASGLFL